jgi:hypothetical protein
MEDDEYPDWLWTLLDDKKTTLGGEKVDLSSKPPLEKKRPLILSNTARARAK